ncbi:hypothetical protein SPBR_07320 [Sporothrix brasiliensis 5110]|uniref:FAD/NAD(P)-binding domain-containing protein n=1 Tax=Sporothrix brasiliensis 5110 TaxID=1398154 RepID=A0A0C2IW26_9PEZI|nr:uncharacterized protein SPBR_07320 [Sporothrix brasiliensis 5110]KIH89162.1 hypothetical protein SPBR_07320 [Sporothrix brasiliensis 5110]
MTASTGPDHTVVVIGAGYVGVPMAHHLAKHTPASVVNLRVILVAPNEEMFWNVASPRGFVPSDSSAAPNPKGNPGFGDDKLFFPLAPSFAKYNTGSVKRVEQVVGRATSLDPDRQTIEVALNTGGTVQTIHYDTALIATGTDITDGTPFKVVPNGGVSETKAALADYRARIRTASHIVVAGGGMTGVEVVGELAAVYGANAPKDKKKEIVFVINEPAPLGVYGTKDSVRQIATNRLKTLGVHIIVNTKVSVATPAAGEGSQTVLRLTSKDGTSTSLTTDVYIPAFGTSFNTKYLPAKLLDATEKNRGRVLTRATLQVEGYDNIFVAGDASNLQFPSLKNANDQITVLAPSLQIYLKNWAVARGAKQNGDAAADTTALKEYKGDDTLIVAVSTGPAGGTGQVGSWKLFSLVIWALKSRFLGTDKAADYASGKRVMRDANW